MICTLRPFKGCRVLESMIRTRISVHITLQLLQQNAVGCSVDTLLSWPRLVVVTAAARLGPVISPLLSNVYLHYVFDLWVQHWRTHRATGEVIVVRYADDMVLGFQHRAEAERFLQDWRERLRSEEHTSELQSRLHLVCRLLLEKKKIHVRLKFAICLRFMTLRLLRFEWTRLRNLPLPGDSPLLAMTWSAGHRELGLHSSAVSGA